MPPLRSQLLIAAVLAYSLVGVPEALGAKQKADLKVSSARATAVASPGSVITVQVRVANAGRGRAQASSVSYQLRAGAMRTVKVVSARRVPALRPGRSSVRSITVRTPEAIRPGHYAIVVCADALGRVAESSERNNCARSQLVSIVPPPPPPSILERPAELTNASSARFAFAGAGSFQCRLDGGGYLPCTSPVDHGSLNEGAHRFEVRTRDRDGRLGAPASVAWRIDVTPPTTPRIVDRPRDPTNSTTATFAIEAEPGARLACHVNESPFFACGPLETYGQLPEGQYQFAVRASDAAGNESATEQVRWRIDLTPPPTPLVGARPRPETYVRSARIEFSFPAAKETTTHVCRFDAAPVSCTGPLSLAGPLRPGRHALSLAARDEAGNEAAAAVEWTILARADGLYGGPGGQAPVAEFEAWRGGAPAGRILEYLRMATWNDIEGGSSPGILERWRGSSNKLVLSTPMLPESGATLAEGADGDYNIHFQKLAQRLVAAGQNDAAIRLGWEFNGDWYPWSAGPNPEAFKLYWRQVVNTMRSVEGAQFTFDWCPNSGPSRSNPELAYPGDGYVDFIGLSAFDAAWGAPDPPTPEWRWETIRNQVGGLVWHRDFANTHGKPMTYPEWGLWKFLDPGYYEDGGSDGQDDPYYIEKMFEWFNANEVAYALYFQSDSPVGLHKLTNFPLGMQRYKALFGSL